MSNHLQRGQEALDRGAWEEARAAFESALEAGGTAEAWEGFATAAACLEDNEAAIAAHERAYRGFRERDDVRNAARIACWIALDYADLRGELVVANGWLRRAERLLEGHGPVPERGFYLLLEGHLALMADFDLVRAREHAAEALEIARLSRSADIECMALALDGLTRVSQGEVAAGMGLLDEATTAALSGDVRDINFVGTACCYLIHACERVRDFDRAGQWCLRVRDFCERWRFTSMFTVCRTQYASVLTMKGAWSEADRELSAAIDELTRRRPSGLPAAVARLGELRRREGALDEAARLFARAGSHRVALLGLAELALERAETGSGAAGVPGAATSAGGDAGGLEAIAEAQSLAERCLRRVPPENRTERVAPLELVARAAAASGNADRAEEAAREIEATAAIIGTDSLRAIARQGRARVAAARGEHEPARAGFEDACELFERAAMPYEEHLARWELARTLAALRREPAARREAELALAGFGRIGAASRVASIERWLAARQATGGASNAVSAPAPAAAASPITARELEVLRLVAAGMSDRTIARRLHLSPHTVHRHVANILTKLDRPSRAAAVAEATRRGLL